MTSYDLLSRRVISRNYTPASIISKSTRASTVMNELRVMGAAIIGDGRCFAALRGLGRTLAGYWEFPGGKVKAGESDDVALIRETPGVI